MKILKNCSAPNTCSISNSQVERDMRNFLYLNIKRRCKYIEKIELTFDLISGAAILKSTLRYFDLRNVFKKVYVLRKLNDAWLLPIHLWCMFYLCRLRVVPINTLSTHLSA